ncbi:hypothetical protein AB0I94_28525 [Streptomyces sp. NPDC050147]|uniref:hypothetical protein n=1 Tax=Streptomyces sp. NPDC050147 TaxID=3155513 RepID=UPI00342E01E1
MPTQPEEPQAEAVSAALSLWPTGAPVRRTHPQRATTHAFLAAGHSKRSVARQLGMTLNTILRFSGATTPEEMFTGQWQSRATKLNAYNPYIDQRRQEDCANAWKTTGGDQGTRLSTRIRQRPRLRQQDSSRQAPPVGPRPPTAPD